MAFLRPTVDSRANNLPSKGAEGESETVMRPFGALPLAALKPDSKVNTADHPPPQGSWPLKPRREGDKPPLSNAASFVWVLLRPTTAPWCDTPFSARSIVP